MARSFNGSSDALYYAGPAASAPPFSISCWFYPTSLAASSGLVGIGYSATDQHYVVLSLATSGAVQFSYTADGSATLATSSTTCTLNTWNHALGVCYADGTIAVYLNGGGKVTGGAATFPTLNETSVGDLLRVVHGNYFTGNIGEVGVWHAALSDADATNLGVNKYAPSLVGTVYDYWLPGSSGALTDSGTGAHTLNANGTSSVTGPPGIVYSLTGATAVTLTGPTSGVTGVASSNFTVGADGTITGTVTVTPSAGGGGGTFSPTSVAISAGTPTATFTYTPASTGTKTISVTNNGSLTDPSSISYVASAPSSATAVTLTGPTSGTVGVTSTNFTAAANGTITGTVTVTPSDSGAGGAFSPTSVAISSGSPTGTFTYTPASAGTKAISVTNNGSLTNPSSISYVVASLGGAGSIAVTLLDRNGSVRANLTGLRWAWFDQARPDLFAAPRETGNGKTTNSGGVLSITLSNTQLSSGSVGFLIVSDTDGTVAFAHRAFAGPVAVQ